MSSTLSNMQILECLCQIRDTIQKDNDFIESNIIKKRELMVQIKKQIYNVEITNEDFEDIFTNIIIELQLLPYLNDGLVQKIIHLRQAIGTDITQNVKSFCDNIFDEVENSIIKTGTYDTPNIGGDATNPDKAYDQAKLGTDDLYKNNTVPKDDLLDSRLFNIPTDTEKSPLVFGNDLDASIPFQQELIRFEELGRCPINDIQSSMTDFQVPQPLTDGYPTNVGDFLKSKNIGFAPTQEANVSHTNPWKEHIQQEINPPDFNGGVVEGRAPGLFGKHKTWTEENKPQVITVTCQTGAIENSGCRDTMQRHQYKYGEFGPGGLYHNVQGLNGTTKGFKVKFHPNLPEQNKSTIWTFDGTFPPKLLVAKYGDGHILRHYNFLPINPEKNHGFGLHTISTHEHNGPSGSESDGFAQSFFFPGQYYDYYYPMTLAGHKSINQQAKHPKASAPMEWSETEGVPLPNKNIPGDWTETMSTHWFHDHMLDFTAQNVYKGNAAMMNYYSSIDRGNEAIDDGVNLKLPSGTALSWGNRDYDVNLLIADKAWDKNGQLWFNPFNKNGFLGDCMLVNWLLKPYMRVRARRYRFRILNASVSRFMKFSLVIQRQDDSGCILGPKDSGVSYDCVPFWLIANDGNLMMHSINMDGTNGTTKGALPVQAIAERFDIVVDFSTFNIGDKLYFINTLEHFHGKRPNKSISLESILSGSYANMISNNVGDPCVCPFLEFRVEKYEGEDLSADMSKFEVGKEKMIPIVPLKPVQIANAVQRNFHFVNKPGTTNEWAIETDGGKAYQMDPRRLSAAPYHNQLEIWTLNNGAVSWAHNVHIHFTEGKILLRDNQLPPIWEQFARKDVYRIGGKLDSSESITIALQFKDMNWGQYMMHCHNTQHEDHAMLLRWDIESKCSRTLPCPYPTWNGVRFLETKAVPTFRTGLDSSNILYVNPRVLLKNLADLQRSVPDPFTGSYFVNGSGVFANVENDAVDNDEK